MHVQVSTSRYLYCLRLTDTHTLSVRPVLAGHIQQFFSTLQTGLSFTAAWCPTAPEQPPFISGHSHTNTPWPAVRFSHSLSLSPCYTQFNRTTNRYGFPILLYLTTTAWPRFTGFRTLDGLWHLGMGTTLGRLYTESVVVGALAAVLRKRPENASC
ncbi:hypothetical protein VTI28DRAFT_6691 [Corynascus sepedonium]